MFAGRDEVMVFEIGLVGSWECGWMGGKVWVWWYGMFLGVDCDVVMDENRGGK